jgi:hypothetical protein
MVNTLLFCQWVGALVRHGATPAFPVFADQQADLPVMLAGLGLDHRWNTPRLLAQFNRPSA